MSAVSATSASESPLLALDVILRSEDDIVEYLVSNNDFRPDVWRSVRYSWLSPRIIGQLEHALASPRHAFSEDVGNDVLRLPTEVLPLIVRHLAWRSRRPAIERPAPGGGFSIIAGATSTEGWAPDTLGERAAPRRSYGFTTAENGCCRINEFPGLFFIWLDPRDPLANNDVASSLPPRYCDNIRAWGAAYGMIPRVYNGSACHAAVAEAATFPDFCDAATYRAMRAFSPPPLHRSSERSHPHGPPIARTRAQLPLLKTYEGLAAAGRWIECVDIARLAILWLLGRGAVYLDTDMAPGPHLLDLSLLSSRPLPKMDSSARLASSAATAPPPAHVTSPPPPLLLLAQDADGVIQNNVMGTSCAHHPFLTLLLRAIIVMAQAESHVIHATGPALITALAMSFEHVRVGNSCPSLTARASQHCCADGVGLLLSSDQASSLASAAPVLAAPPFGRTRPVAPLPDPPPPEAFPHLASIPRLLADGLRALPCQGFISSVAGIDAVGDAAGFADGPSDHWLDFSFKFGECIRLLPPSAFYPRHWRPDSDAALRVETTPATSQTVQSAAFMPQVLPPLRPFASVAALSAASVEATALQIAAAVPQSLLLSSVAGAAALAIEPVRVALPLDGGRLPPDQAGMAAVRLHSWRPALGPGVVPLKGSASSLSAADHDEALPQGGAEKAGSAASDASAIVCFGSHGWDCTWGSAATSAPGSSATSGGYPTAQHAPFGSVGAALSYHNAGAGSLAATLSYGSAAVGGYGLGGVRLALAGYGSAGAGYGNAVSVLKGYGSALVLPDGAMGTDDHDAPLRLVRRATSEHLAAAAELQLRQLAALNAYSGAAASPIGSSSADGRLDGTGTQSAVRGGAGASPGPVHDDVEAGSGCVPTPALSVQPLTDARFASLWKVPTETVFVTGWPSPTHGSGSSKGAFQHALSAQRDGSTAGAAPGAAESAAAAPAADAAAARLHDIETGVLRHANDVFGCAGLAVRTARAMLEEGWLALPLRA